MPHFPAPEMQPCASGLQGAWLSQLHLSDVSASIFALTGADTPALQRPQSSVLTATALPKSTSVECWKSLEIAPWDPPPPHPQASCPVEEERPLGGAAAASPLGRNPADLRAAGRLLQRTFKSLSPSLFQVTVTFVSYIRFNLRARTVIPTLQIHQGQPETSRLSPAPFLAVWP